MNDSQEEIYNGLLELTTEEVVNAFLNWQGTQILTNDFKDFLVNEGLLNN
jgi:hypothetical protein